MDIYEVDNSEKPSKSSNLTWYLFDSSMILLMAICVIGLIGITIVGIPWWWG